MLKDISLKLVSLLIVAIILNSVFTSCQSHATQEVTSNNDVVDNKDYSLNTVKAAYEEIIHELFDKRQLYDTISMTGYSGTEIILSFYSQADTDIVNLVQSMIDNRIPGIRLVVNENVPAPSPMITWIPEITRMRAIELASQSLLPDSIVNRAVITAELHGWYWEVTFGDLNAKYEELSPWPLKPPPPFPGTTLPPDISIYQSVVITIDAQTGNLSSAGAFHTPEPGPYISRESAIELARETLFNMPDETHWGISPEWFETASVEAYLRGDKWIVIFWNESSDDRYYSVTLNAVTGENISSEGKYTPPGSVTPPIFP